MWSRRAKRPLIDVVIDTNVFVSALTGGRITSQIYTAILDAQLTVVLSLALFDELLSTLARPVFELSPDDIQRVATFLALSARFVHPKESVTDCRDPKDNKLLECLLAAHPTCLVTGDRDLLVLHPYRSIPIVTPRAFITRYLR